MFCPAAVLCLLEPGGTMSQSMDPCDQVLSTGGSVVSDVLSLALVPVVHGLPQPV